MQEKELDEIRSKTEKLTSEVEDSLKSSEQLQSELKELSHEVDTLQQKALELTQKLGLNPTTFIPSFKKDIRPFSLSNLIISFEDLS